MASELADIYEVIDALAELYQISKDEILAAQTKKRAERGGYELRRYATIAEHLKGSVGEVYCLNDPEKYPEI